MGDASEKTAEIRVIAVGALQSGLKPLGDEFTKQSGHPVDCTFTSPANLNSVISSGQFDVIVAAAPWIEEFDKAGGVLAGSRVKVGRVGIGVAVREGAFKPDVSTPDAFKKAIMAARNIVYTDPATPNGSGVVTMRILAAAGLVDVVKGKGKQSGLGPGRELIASGEYEMGLFNITEITMPGVMIAGPIPAQLQDYTNYDGAVTVNSSNKIAATDFLRFVAGKPVGTP
jgi:molybdate transport system substrate-binding protein